MALTAAEEAYFQETLSRVKYSVNFWVPVEVCPSQFNGQ